VNLPPFRLERYFAQHEFNAPHLLCVSDCQSMSVGELLALEPSSREKFDSLQLGYTETPGGWLLREQIATLYEGFDPQEVLVHVGAEEAIFTFATACLHSGDEVIVQTPCYQSLYQVAESRGCRVLSWVCREEDGWVPDLDELARLVNRRTKAVFINSPHNPTGSCLTPKAMEGIVEIVTRTGCLLFSDEVYRFMEFEEEQAPRPACELYDRAVSLGVMSKSLGLAGLRVGWAACREKGILEAMSGVKDYTTICGSAPSEFLAALALRRKDVILSRIRKLIQANLSLFKSFMDRQAGVLAWVEPKAGPIAFPRLASGEDSESFCRDVLEGSGVLLLPGRLYGEEWKAHFRVGFGRSGFAEGLDAWDTFLMKP